MSGVRVSIRQGVILAIVAFDDPEKKRGSPAGTSECRYCNRQIQMSPCRLQIRKTSFCRRSAHPVHDLPRRFSANRYGQSPDQRNSHRPSSFRLSPKAPCGCRNGPVSSSSVTQAWNSRGVIEQLTLSLVPAPVHNCSARHLCGVRHSPGAADKLFRPARMSGC